jgi:membrane protein YqaA with SNARE-associated domain
MNNILIDPQTFLGAIIVTILGGILLYFIQLLLSRYLDNKKKVSQTDHFTKHKASKYEKFLISFFFIRKLSKVIRQYNQKLINKI